MRLIKQITSWEEYGKATGETCMIAFVYHGKHGVVEIRSADLSAMQYITMLALALSYNQYYEVWTYGY